MTAAGRWQQRPLAVSSVTPPSLTRSLSTITSPRKVSDARAFTVLSVFKNVSDASSHGRIFECLRGESYSAIVKGAVFCSALQMLAFPF